MDELEVSSGSSKENSKPSTTSDDNNVESSCLEPRLSIHERMKLLSSNLNQSNNSSVDEESNKMKVQRRNLIRFQTQVFVYFISFFVNFKIDNFIDL
jgi:hypothetical protein